MQRLKTRAQFQAVMAGATVARTAHFVLHRAELDNWRRPAAGPVAPGRTPALFAVRDVWVGVVTPKRWARHAVTRNAIKRQIHDMSATFEARLPVAAHVVRLRAGFDRARFVSANSEPLKRAVRAELRQLFERAEQAARPPAGEVSAS